MNHCYAITGVFVPTNEPMTLLSYKYLRGLDIPVDVIALKHAIDPNLEKKLENDPKYKNFRVKWIGKYNDALFSIHNVNLFKALNNVEQYIELAVTEFDSKKYDVLYTSSFPTFTIHAGLKIKEKYPDIPWIASFTDPINHSPYKNDLRTYKEYSLPEKVAFKLYCKHYVNDADEIIAFDHADILVFICEEQRDFMIEQYLNTVEPKFSKEELLDKSVIFPLNYIPEWNDIVKLDKVEKDPTFTFAHFGRVYGLRDATNFIYAVNELKENKNIPNFVIKQYGEFRKSDKKLIQKLGIEKYFEIHDKIPYSDAIKEMNKADILLIFDTIMPEDEIQPYLPSKVLEYSLLEKNTLTITTSKSPSYRIAKVSDALVCKDTVEDIKETMMKSFTVQESILDYHADNESASTQLREKLKKFY